MLEQPFYLQGNFAPVIFVPIRADMRTKTRASYSPLCTTLAGQQRLRDPRRTKFLRRSAGPREASPQRVPMGFHGNRSPILHFAPPARSVFKASLSQRGGRFSWNAANPSLA